MTRPRKWALTLLLAACSAAAAGTAEAATTLAALSSDKRLTIIDADNLRVLRSFTIGGPAGRVIGIDVRPQDNLLYGVWANGMVLTINPNNGMATPRVRLAQTLPAGVRASVDFNPAADRLRLIGSDGTSLAANVLDGTVVANTNLNFVQPNPFGGVTPRVVAAAYSNSVNGAKGTLLFDIDQATNAFYAQVPPAAGSLNPLGLLGISVGTLGFDIQTSSTGKNRGLIVTNNRLMEIDLAGGAVQPPFRRITGLNASVRDIAVLP
jgi:hypothetical protein